MIQKHLGIVLLGACLLVSRPSQGKEWIASGGLGLTVSPTLLMINPQLEYVYRPNLFFGPMIQAGLGDVGTLFTFSGTVRYLVGHHPRVRPALEGGLGLAVGSSSFSSSVGVHITFGMGVDFVLEPTIILGTMIRANFAPPLDTFFMSWPIIVARFIL